MASNFFAHDDKDKYNPDKWKSSSSLGLPERCPETQLNVLIIGGGLAGLMTALECWRKGHNVVGILERSENPVCSGLFVSLAEIHGWVESNHYIFIYRRHYHHGAIGSMRIPPLARHVPRS